MKMENNPKVVFLENEKRYKCPVCNETFAFSNDKDEIFYRNVTMFYISKKDKILRTKCRKCKNILELKEDEVFK
jgi:transcription elongation factor Elf1